MAEGMIMVVYIIAMVALLYFITVRPQRKEQKRLEELLSTIEKGDSVCTTAGFYGVVIAIEEDMVIVEFGSNKNCRIPMKKTSIIEVEKG